jgi:hypothetical protein
LFSAPGLVFGGAEGLWSRFHVLLSQIRFRRNLGHRVPFTCFARADSFSAVSRASLLVFMFSSPGLVFDGTEGVRSRFHVLALSDSFSTELRASGPFYLFCAPGLIFGGLEGVPSRFHVFRSRTCFRRYRGRRDPFSRFAFRDTFSAVPRASGSILRSQTHFRRYRGRRVLYI